MCVFGIHIPFPSLGNFFLLDCTYTELHGRAEEFGTKATLLLFCVSANIHVSRFSQGGSINCEIHTFSGKTGYVFQIWYTRSPHLISAICYVGVPWWPCNRELHSDRLCYLSSVFPVTIGRCCTVASSLIDRTQWAMTERARWTILSFWTAALLASIVPGQTIGTNHTYSYT